MKKIDIKEMRALSIAQPWAHCIVHKGKNVENRTWTTRYRGTIAIHASAGMSKEHFFWCEEDHGIKLDPKNTPGGVIVGFAEILEVITKKAITPKTTKWFVGKYGFVLGNIMALEKPVHVKGALGFWRLKGKPLKACLDQLSVAKLKKFKEFLKVEPK
jgi:hypothetical protein